MGLETMIMSAVAKGAMASKIATGLNVVSGISSVVGGISGLQEGRAQAKSAMQQARMEGEEKARIAAKEANIERSRSEDVVRRQKLAYLASGVSLEGSPLLVMAETRRKGLENVDEIIKAGAAGKVASEFQGRMQARQARSLGRRSFIEGLTGAGNAFARIGAAR